MAQPNQPLLDKFTAGHMAIGAALALTKLKPSTVLMLAIGWELIEPILKKQFPEIFPRASIDSIGNKAGDVAGNMLGFAIVRALRK